MKVRISRQARAAIAATAANMVLPPEADVRDAPGIPQAELERLAKSAGQGNLTESELQQIVRDQQRAKRKRKNAVIAGNPTEAASASSQDQTITQMIVPYALSGVRSRPGNKKGGRVAGMKAREQGDATKAKVHKWATQLLSSHFPRDISGIICRELKLSRSQVLKHLRDHPSGKWPTRAKEKVK